MSHPRQADLDALIVVLIEAGVELIVVGGAAAVLHGAPVTTVDLDIVHRRTPENVERLLAVLTRLETTYRAPAKPGLRPNRGVAARRRADSPLDKARPPGLAVRPSRPAWL